MKIKEMWQAYKIYKKLKGGINMGVLTSTKTYICAIAIGLATIANYLGYIDAELLDMLQGLSGACGLAALRAGVNEVWQMRILIFTIILVGCVPNYRISILRSDPGSNRVTGVHSYGTRFDATFKDNGTLQELKTLSDKESPQFSLQELLTKVIDVGSKVIKWEFGDKEDNKVNTNVYLPGVKD